MEPGVTTTLLAGRLPGAGLCGPVLWIRRVACGRTRPCLTVTSGQGGGVRLASSGGKHVRRTIQECLPYISPVGVGLPRGKGSAQGRKGSVIAKIVARVIIVYSVRRRVREALPVQWRKGERRGGSQPVVRKGGTVAVVRFNGRYGRKCFEQRCLLCEYKGRSGR